MTTKIRRRGPLVAIAGVTVVLLAGCTIRLAAGNGNTSSPSVSDDGRYVAFNSYASDLVADDDNGKGDIFLLDRDTGSFTQVTRGNGDSYFPDLSGDGRFVAFLSFATDLVPGDALGSDLFLWDRTSGTTTRITPGLSSEHEFSMSDDGRYVAYASSDSPAVPGDTNGLTDVLVWDRITGLTTRITGGRSPGGWSGSWLPSISADGGRVAFTSEAIDVIPGDTTPGRNIFVWDRASGATTRVTGSASAWSQRPEISDDGEHVAFWSVAALAPGDPSGMDLYVWDRSTATNHRIPTTGANGSQPTLSADGHLVAYGGSGAIRLWDRTAGSAQEVATGDGWMTDADLAPNGDVLVYTTPPTVVGEDITYSDVAMWLRPAS